jgi:transcriptional regulator with XRE-family HTH domain
MKETGMIGDRLQAIRKHKQLSQGDIEQRTGLLRCYISRVENGHTVPTIETLEKMARALEVPLYQLFYEGQERPLAAPLKAEKALRGPWRGSRKWTRLWHRFHMLLGRMDKADQHLLLFVAQKMAHKRKT